MERSSFPCMASLTNNADGKGCGSSAVTCEQLAKEFYVSVTLEQSEELSAICLEGAIGIAEAAELKLLLLRALEMGKEVRIQLERTADLDVTAVQLLWAAERAASEEGVAFMFAGMVPKQIAAALTDAGFKKFSVSD